MSGQLDSSLTSLPPCLSLHVFVRWRVVRLGGDVSSMNVDDFVRVLGTGELLVALGEDFGKNESKDLRAMLRTKAKAFFDK